MAINKNKKPSILFINRIFPPDKGATALRLMELAEFMAQKGWAVTILTAKGREEVPENLHENIQVRRMSVGTTHYPIPFSEYPRLLIEFAWALLWTKSHNVTVTMTDPPLLACVAPLLRLFKRTKLVHWSHDMYPELLPLQGVKWSTWFFRLMQWKMKFALKRHHKIVVIGRDMARFMIEKRGIAKEKVVIINNWPDTFFENYELPGKDENPFVMKDRTTFLYSGNFGLVHEFETLLQGIKLLEPKKYPLRFLFVGQGRRLDEIQERVAELGLESVQFVSYQPEARVKELLDAGDVHLASMKDETTGLLMPSKVNSAFAMKKPVIFIGSPQSEAGRLITEYKAGVVIDGQDDKAKYDFAKAVADYVTNRTAWGKASAGSEKCGQAIAREKMAGLFEQMARSLLSHSS